MLFRLRDAAARAPHITSRLVDVNMVREWSPRLRYEPGQKAHWFAFAYLEVEPMGQHTDLFHVGLVTSAAARGGAQDIACAHGVHLFDVISLPASLDDMHKMLNGCTWLLPASGAVPACKFTRGEPPVVRNAKWDHQLLAWDGQRALIRRRVGRKDDRRPADELSIEPRWVAELPCAETQLHRWDENLLRELERQHDSEHAAYVLESYLRTRRSRDEQRVGEWVSPAGSWVKDD